MPVVITQTIRPQGMGLNVLVRLLPLYEFCCNFKRVAWKNVQCWHWQHCWHLFLPHAGWRMHVFICSFKVFGTNTVKCFQTTLVLNSYMFSSLLTSFPWKVLNQVRNLALTVLNCNSEPRKKFYIFLKPSGCLSLFILLLVRAPEAKHGNPQLCSYRDQGGSPREIFQASGWFSLPPVRMFAFWWGQRLATASWRAMISHGMWMYTTSSSVCAQSGCYFPLPKRGLGASLLPNKYPFVSFYHWTS